MKKPLVILLFLTLSMTSVYPQDILTDIYGKSVRGQFIEISYPSIRFQIEGVPSPTNIQILTVSMVVLGNGTVVFDLSRVHEFLGEAEAEKIFELSQNARPRIKKATELIGNTQSKLIHLGSSGHLPPESLRKVFPSVEAALKDGFTKCQACYYFPPNIDDYELEMMLARSVNASVRSQYEILYEYPELDRLTEAVNRILNGWGSDLTGFDYRVLVLRDSDPNAFAVAGGNIYITSGLIQLIETQEELEFVLAHEIAHIEERHTVKHYKDLQRKKLISSVLSLLVVAGTGAAGGSQSDIGRVAQIMTSTMEYANILMSAGFSRELEQAADIRANLYMSNVPIHRSNAINILDKLLTRARRAKHTATMSAFSSHPSLSDRIRHIRQSQVMDIEPSPQYQSNHISGAPSGSYLSISLSQFYQAPSSTDRSKQLFIFWGQLKNTVPARSFRIEGLSIVAKPPVQETARLKELDGFLSPSGSEKEFSFRIEVGTDNSEAVLSAIRQGRITLNSKISEVVVLAGGGTKPPRKRFQQNLIFSSKLR